MNQLPAIRATWFTLALLALASLASAQRSSSLNVEPGTMSLEGIEGLTVRLTVAQQAPIYYTAVMDRPLGTMAAGTPVTIVAMSDIAYRVRGRAMHGDTAGWMRMTDIKSPDPDLPKKLKAIFDRHQQVQDLIAKNEVAIGMTPVEVQQSLGKPTRKSSRITAAGRQDTLEYAVFEKIPQMVTGRDQFGHIVQSVVYVKTEVGRLSVAFKDGYVEAIEETKGEPLAGGSVKIVPPPIIFR
jgi:hypothetical protein